MSYFAHRATKTNEDKKKYITKKIIGTAERLDIIFF